MPRKPKAKDGLTAGQRVALYEAEQERKKLEKLDKNTQSAEKAAADGAEAVEKAILEEKKAQKPLPKPQHATVRVDLSSVVGAIRPMHAMCNGPKSFGADISHLFKEAGIPLVRFDDTDTCISSCAIDVSRIFKNPAADPRDPASYDFATTDEYVAAAYNAGARVIYRLGESRGLAGASKTVKMPDDIDAFVAVCINIIKHYNDYWANGYAYGIDRFEIWSHDADLTGRELTAEFELYRRVATAIKLYDSDLSVGGMSFDIFDGNMREFIRFCAKTHTPIDFISLSCLASDPVKLSDAVKKVIPVLRNMGFADTEVIIGKWGYVDDAMVPDGAALERLLTLNGENACAQREKLFSAQSDVKGAAYALATMIELHNMGEVGAAFFYDAQPAISPWCAICSRFGIPQKPFYAFSAFGRLYRAGREVLSVSEQTEGYAHTGIYALAATSEGGESYVLISSFGGCGVVDLRLDGISPNVYEAEIYLLDGVKDMALGDTVAISGSKKRLLLNLSEYGAALIRIY
jgi:hypothetical protein